jgi:putative sterol carrier protein
MVQQQQPNSVKEVMEGMPQAFDASKAAGANATIQFNFTGPEAGSYTAKIADGKCDVTEGNADNPTVTINSPSDVWLKIIRGELDGATAFMSGQFTFTGDMGVLMQMQSWFPRQA